MPLPPEIWFVHTSAILLPASLCVWLFWNTQASNHSNIQWCQTQALAANVITAMGIPLVYFFGFWSVVSHTIKQCLAKVVKGWLAWSTDVHAEKIQEIMNNKNITTNDTTCMVFVWIHDVQMFFSNRTILVWSVQKTLIKCSCVSYGRDPSLLFDGFQLLTVCTAKKLQI